MASHRYAGERVKRIFLKRATSTAMEDDGGSLRQVGIRQEPDGFPKTGNLC